MNTATAKRPTGNPHGRLSRIQPPAVRDAIAHSVALGLATFATYLVTAHILTYVYSLSRADDLLGGMWAVIATIFVYHDSYRQSIAAALSRIAATSVSFILCFVYLLLLPFHAWGLALLIALGALVARLAGRPGDAITTAITTAVVLVVAELSPHDAWQQPILRWVDTVIGVAMAVVACRIAVAVGDPPAAPRDRTAKRQERLMAAPALHARPLRGVDGYRLHTSRWQ
jgi:uncharacterized membrane protein YccC